MTDQINASSVDDKEQQRTTVDKNLLASSTTWRQTFLGTCLKHGALQFGSFTLKSGRQSPYFFNSGQLSDGEGALITATAYAHAIVESGVQVDMLFGPAYKGIPWVATTAAMLQCIFGKSLPYCYNRKEPKDHGEGGTIVTCSGTLRPKDESSPQTSPTKVCIIDDTMTAGTAILESLKILSDYDTEVKAVVVALDRQECIGGIDVPSDPGQRQSIVQQVESQHGIKVIRIISTKELLPYVQSLVKEKNDYFSEILQKMVEYRQKYGVELS